MAGVAECKHYIWRRTLKLYRLKEEANKDVRRKSLWGCMEEGINIAHCLGPKKQDGPHRSIIILFALHCTQ